MLMIQSRTFTPRPYDLETTVAKRLLESACGARMMCRGTVPGKECTDTLDARRAVYFDYAVTLPSGAKYTAVDVLCLACGAATARQVSRYAEAWPGADVTVLSGAELWPPPPPKAKTPRKSRAKSAR